MSNRDERADPRQSLGVRPAYAAEIEEFYRDFFLPLVRHAIRRHRMNIEDAGDVVQDAFVLALGKLDPTGNPRAWLYQVVDHLAVNWQRKKNRRAQLLARFDTANRNGLSETDCTDEALG